MTYQEAGIPLNLLLAYIAGCGIGVIAYASVIYYVIKAREPKWLPVFVPVLVAYAWYEWNFVAFTVGWIGFLQWNEAVRWWGPLVFGLQPLAFILILVQGEKDKAAQLQQMQAGTTTRRLGIEDDDG